MSNNETQKFLKPPNPRHLDEARKARIKLIRRSATDPNGNIYECPKCRTELALRADLVRKKLNRQDLESWPCEICKWEKYKGDAHNANLEIIKKAENTHNLIYKCGCIPGAPFSLLFMNKFNDNSGLSHLSEPLL